MVNDIMNMIDNGRYTDAIEEMHRKVVVNGLKRYIKIAMKALDGGDKDTYAITVLSIRESLKTLEMDGIDEMMRAIYSLKGENDGKS